MYWIVNVQARKFRRGMKMKQKDSNGRVYNEQKSPLLAKYWIVHCTLYIYNQNLIVTNLSILLLFEGIRLCQKPSDSLSELVTLVQGHLLSCSGQLKVV